MSISSIGAGRAARARRRRRVRALAAGLPQAPVRPAAFWAHHEAGGFGVAWRRDAR